MSPVRMLRANLLRWVMLPPTYWNKTHRFFVSLYIVDLGVMPI